MILNASDEKHNIAYFKVIHERKNVERFQSGFVVSGVIMQNVLGSMSLDTFEEFAILHLMGPPDNRTVTKM